MKLTKQHLKRIENMQQKVDSIFNHYTQFLNDQQLSEIENEPIMCALRCISVNCEEIIEQNDLLTNNQ